MAQPYQTWSAWRFGIGSVLLTVIYNISIVVLLSQFDGQAVPDWGRYLNLNALLALFSTFLRATIVIVIAQVISERKWAWFSDCTRPLSDMERFDSASRGGLGAFSLIPAVLWRDPITLIGGLITIISFLTGPFVQQASRTRDCYFPAPGLDASIPYAHYVPARGGYYRTIPDPKGFASEDLFVAIMSSLTTPQGPDNQITATCTTGNCTFTADMPDFGERKGNQNRTASTAHSTVGVCSKCTDVTSLVTQRNITSQKPEVIPATSKASQTETRVEYFLPTTPWKINVTAAYIRDGDPWSHPIEIMPSLDLNWMGGLLGAKARTAARWAYINATFLATEVRNATSVGSMCSLYPCMRTYVSTVTDNVLTENLLRSNIMELETNSTTNQTWLQTHNTLKAIPGDFVSIGTPCQADGQTYKTSQYGRQRADWKTLTLVDFSMPNGSRQAEQQGRTIEVPETCIYRHNTKFANAIADLLNDVFFTGGCSYYGEVQVQDCRWYKRANGSSDNDGSIVNIAPDRVMKALYSNGNTSFPDIDRWFEAFASAMTNKFRSEYGGIRWNSTDELSELMPLDIRQGTAWRSAVCVSMHWRWLLLPWLLTLLTVLIAAWTMFSDWRHRFTRPVWKESILPYLFYSDRISPKEQICVSTDADQRGILEVDKATSETGKLMELSEMRQIASGIPVRLLWTQRMMNFNGGEADASSSALELSQFSMRSRYGQLSSRDHNEPSIQSGIYGRLSISEEGEDPTDMLAERA
jgi:hypothetical protein